MIRKLIIDEHGDVACYVHGKDAVKALLVDRLDDTRLTYVCDVCDAWEDVEKMDERRAAL